MPKRQSFTAWTKLMSGQIKLNQQSIDSLERQIHATRKLNNCLKRELKLAKSQEEKLQP